MTIGLCVITKEITPELEQTLKSYLPHVDTIYVQVNGKGAVSKSYKKSPFVVSTYEWNDNFADARNDLLAQVETDYWSWLDSDDLLVGAENFRTIVQRMEDTGVELIYAPYLYKMDPNGLPLEVQNRERVIKSSLSGQWHGRVHETFIPNGSTETEHTTLVQWLHAKTEDEHDQSAIRNRKLMLQGYEEEQDPRYAYYLGLNYGMTGEFEESNKWFYKLIEDGGWDEERYRAYLQIGSNYQQMKAYGEAIGAYQQATTELPNYPDAYFGMQQVYYEVDAHEKALEWYKIGLSKPAPESNSAFSPVVRIFQPKLLATYSYLATGEPKLAAQTLAELKRIAPDYREADKLEQVVTNAYNDALAIEAAQTLIKYNLRYKGDALATLDSLPASLRSDLRLTDERRQLIPARVWPKDSVVIYCGGSFEPWGPDTLDKGMGGSEEAIVYLAREFAKQGKSVTVFNERQEMYEDWEHEDDDPKARPDDLGVKYLPWTEINPNDTFDTFIAWRDPSVLKSVKARVKLCDIHDIISPQVVYKNESFVDKYCFKTKFHREVYDLLPDEKCVVIGNGINKGDFNAAN